MSKARATRVRFERTRLALCRCAVLAVTAPMPEGTARASGFLTDQFGSDQGQPGARQRLLRVLQPGRDGRDARAPRSRSTASSRRARSTTTLGIGSHDPPDRLGGALLQRAEHRAGYLFNVLAAPFVGFVTDFGGCSWRLGVASYIPFGGELSWGKNQTFAEQHACPRRGTTGRSAGRRSAPAPLPLRDGGPRLPLRAGPRFGLGLELRASSARADRHARARRGRLGRHRQPRRLAQGRPHLPQCQRRPGRRRRRSRTGRPTKDGTLRLGASYTSQPNFGTMRLSTARSSSRRAAVGAVDGGGPACRPTPTSSASAGAGASARRRRSASTATGSAGASSRTSASSTREAPARRTPPALQRTQQRWSSSTSRATGRTR